MFCVLTEGVFAELITSGPMCSGGQPPLSVLVPPTRHEKTRQTNKLIFLFYRSTSVVGRGQLPGTDPPRPNAGQHVRPLWKL